MPANVGFEYEKAEKEYLQAKTFSDKLICLRKMLSSLSKHKGNEALQKDLKRKISKYKELLEKEKKATKKSGKGLSIKKEGAAQVVIIGKTNTGKSFLLSKLTNAKPLIADYEFTTTVPEIGTMDYDGVLIQVIEVPAITEGFMEKEKGPMFLGIIRGADLAVILGMNEEDYDLVGKELDLAGINIKRIYADSYEDIGTIKDQIWKNLGLIYVYTKTPGKDKDYPPVALDEGSTIKDLARKVHKDFVKKFEYAKLWGSSVRYDGLKVSIDHVLKNGDVVEFHLK